MKRILALDDEAPVLRLLESVLGASGYDVTATSDPSQALSVLRDQSIDLMLLDIRMPTVSGLDIYSTIRKIRDIPVLFVTAYPGSFTTEAEVPRELWENHVTDGNTDIIYKPFHLAALREKVEQLIGPAAAQGDAAP